ncbi:MAG: Mrp/NBP35 family ATP-binding protein [Sphaerochaetaceae bacterium]|nr:Mrp/NBP35 family ATP-binding protein [Sphaerochaetaceae bacterium]NLV83217.1 Mrp/NBP35 family ATP-binding protein [Spirochaetales bacterium]
MAPMDFEKRVAQRQAIRSHLDLISRKILVMSGKGGVGKTTVTVELALQLTVLGYTVGILDTDLHGPNVAKLLKVDLGTRFGTASDAMLHPVQVKPNLFIAGVDSAMENPLDAVIWRGPMKSMVINDLLARVDWGTLDYLLIDSPPGSGDEHLTICKTIPELTGAIIVTTPQELALLDSRRSVEFCRKMGIAILGIVENMSGLVCPHCGNTVAVFGSDGAQSMARQTGTPFLGSIPIEVMKSSDTADSHALMPSAARQAFRQLAARLADGMTSTIIKGTEQTDER